MPPGRGCSLPPCAPAGDGAAPPVDGVLSFDLSPPQAARNAAAPTPPPAATSVRRRLSLLDPTRVQWPRSPVIVAPSSTAVRLPICRAAVPSITTIYRLYCLGQRGVDACARAVSRLNLAASGVVCEDT